MEPTKQRASRDLTREDLPWIFGVLVVITAFIVLVATGHPIAGAVVLGGFTCVAFWRMPREQREAVGRDLQRRERTPAGRVSKSIEMLGALLVLYFLIKAAAGTW